MFDHAIGLPVLHQRPSCVHAIAFCNCSDCYRLERQLPGGIRTHEDAVPFHGAREMRASTDAR
jgi:hypothetical protein